MDKTKIEWADATWNPVTGCLHGCEYCYARKMANRFSEKDNDGDFTIYSYYGEWDVPIVELDEPMQRKTKAGKNVVSPFPLGFSPTLHRYRLNEPQRWKKPRTIFVCSMADLFGDCVPDSWIAEVFDACGKAPQHRYLFLTKNPKRYVELYVNLILPVKYNFWYGATCTGPDVPFYYIRMPDDNPHTFASIEPILQPFGEIKEFPEWVILGAETGRRKGKVVPEKDWIDNIVRQAQERYIPVFMKDSLIPIIGKENMRREFPWR